MNPDPLSPHSIPLSTPPMKLWQLIIFFNSNICTLTELLHIVFPSPPSIIPYFYFSFSIKIEYLILFIRFHRNNTLFLVCAIFIFFLTLLPSSSTSGHRNHDFKSIITIRNLQLRFFFLLFMFYSLCLRSFGIDLSVDFFGLIKFICK